MSQKQIFFNSLKGQFTTKDAFLKFNFLKKYNTERVTHASLSVIGSTGTYHEPRGISNRTIFEARKGLTSVFHPIFGGIFLFGGTSQTTISTIETFNEETFEYQKLVEGRPTYYTTQSSLATAKQPSSIKTKNQGGTQRKENSLHFKETPSVRDYQTV